MQGPHEGIVYPVKEVEQEEEEYSRDKRSDFSRPLRLRRCENERGKDDDAEFLVIDGRQGREKEAAALL